VTTAGELPGSLADWSTDFARSLRRRGRSDATARVYHQSLPGSGIGRSTRGLPLTPLRCPPRTSTAGSTDDWDRRQDFLTLRGKTGLRVVPISPSTGEALGRYMHSRADHPAAERTDALWLGGKSAKGVRSHAGSLRATRTAASPIPDTERRGARSEFFAPEDQRFDVG
jgi:hypothetical protein